MDQIKEPISPTSPLTYLLHHKQLLPNHSAVPYSCISTIPWSKPSRLTCAAPSLQDSTKCIINLVIYRSIIEANEINLF